VKAFLKGESLMEKNKKRSPSRAKEKKGKGASHRSGVSRSTFLKEVGAGVAAAGLGAAATGGVAKAYHPPGSTYSPTGGNATITRDEYGVPHITADTDYDLFYGLGYATAEDRLFQYHTSRLAGRGRLSELLGPGEIMTDVGLRLYYTQPDDVLLQQFQACSPKFQEATNAWLNGLNTYISEMKTRYLQYGDPSLVPFEFLYFGFMPEDFTAEDFMGLASYLTVSNAALYTDQLDNAQFLGALMTFHGEVKGGKLFNDVAWFDDSEAEVTLPSTQGKAYKKLLTMPSEMPDFESAQFYVPTSNFDMDKRLKKAGVSLRLGSMTLAIHQSKSDDHRPLFGGGFQLSFGVEAPPNTNEAHLTGGESGYNIQGTYFGPVIISARTEHFNFTAMVGYGANNDWYQEKIMMTPDGLMYLYKEGGNADPENLNDWVPFEPIGVDPQRTILVRGTYGNYEYSDDFGGNWNPCDVDPALAPSIPDGSDPQNPYKPLPSYWLFKASVGNPLVFPLLKSVHGPLMGIEGPYGFTIKRVNYETEYKHGHMFFDFGLANTFDEFRTAVRKNDANQHISYTGYRYLEDGEGAAPIIAYFFTGAFPLREEPGTVPASDYNGDPRLPRWGTGEDEWIGTETFKFPDPENGPFLRASGGTTYPHIECTNPSTGFLANWNSKPTTDFPFGCASQSYWSIGHGVHRIQRGVMEGVEKYKKLTAGEPDPLKYGKDLEDVLKEIQSNYYRFDSFYYLRPHLLEAAAELTGHAIHGHTQGPEALATIQEWDLNAFDPPTGLTNEVLYGTPAEPGLIPQTLELSAEYVGLQILYGNLEDYFDPITGTPVGDCATGWPPACQAWYEWLLDYGQLYAQWQYRWGNEDSGFVIFKKWADKMHDALFSDVLSVSYQPYYLRSFTSRYAKLIHVLDHAMTGYSGVPPSLDYFGGEDPKQFMLDMLVQALDDLEEEGYSYPWDNKPRIIYEVNTSVGPCGFVGDAEWITYCQMISYRTGIAKNRLETGQSGFITVYPFPHEDNFIPVQLPSVLGGGYLFFDNNMFSQMELLYNFKYKPATLD
jgi:hypothetical protein